MLTNKIKKVIPKAVGTKLKALIALLETDHSYHTRWPRKKLANPSPLAPIMRNKKPNNKNPTGIPYNAIILSFTLHPLLMFMNLFVNYCNLLLSLYKVSIANYFNYFLSPLF